MQKRTVTGRIEGGPACFGCRHYTATQTGHGRCTEIGKAVTATDRRGCALYELLRTTTPVDLFNQPPDKWRNDHA